MYNEATLIGRVGKKDIRTLKNGSQMATIYLATTDNWIDKGGIKQEQSTWHNVNFFDKLADIVEKYVHVGNLVFIRGKINHKQIPEGEKKGQWSYSLTANLIKLLPNTKKSDDEKSLMETSVPKSSTVRANAPIPSFDDEIPF